MKTTESEKVDKYIAEFPPDVREKLEVLRATIQKAAPSAEEVISYSMPAFRLNGMLAYYAAYPNHIGFYPGPSGIEAFQSEISKYKWAKGSVQFPLGKPVPTALVSKIIRFRSKENLSKLPAKKKK